LVVATDVAITKETDMSRFNARTQPPQADTTNMAGGCAFTQSPKLRLASALLTSTLQDSFYETGQRRADSIVEMVTALDDKLFAAKAAVWARRVAGLRSVSHIVAGEIGHSVKGQTWTRPFFQKIVRRPDDILEIMGYYAAKYGVRKDPKPNAKGKIHKRGSFPNAMKDGFAKVLSTFDEYQLAKYPGTGHDVNMLDAVHICKPKATAALSKLIKGTLGSAETWETKLSAAGRVEAETPQEKEAAVEIAKEQAWVELLQAKKLGYLACLRNLRNIAEQAPKALPLALDFLADQRQVEKSLVLPFQFLVAMKVIDGTPAATSAVKHALNKAMEYSVANVPVFEGSTLFAIDVSGSMRGSRVNGQAPERKQIDFGGRKDVAIGASEIASLFAGAMFKKQQDADVMLFDGRAEYMDLNPDDTLATICARIWDRTRGGTTDFRLPFQYAKKAYDRIVILSDMQGWVGYNTPDSAHRAYKTKFNCNPRIYVFDVTGLGTMQFPEDKVCVMAGWSDSVLKLMQNLEADPQALVEEISKVVL
jgi:hypothetical protein